MRGLFFRHPAVCRPPAIAQSTPIRGLFFQHINRIIARPSAPRPVTHNTHRYSRWYYDPWKVALAMVPLICIGAGGAVIPDYYGYLETVPITNRTHIFLRSPLEEREHGESRFAYHKQKYASIIILDQHHHVSASTTSPRNLYEPSTDDVTIESHDTVTLHRGNVGSPVEVMSTRKAQPATGHLNGLNWEVMVVKDKRVNTWCYHAGKIIVSTGLLQVYKTDAELAAIIAHEIGHVVARHWAEKIIYRKCLPRLLRVPFFRRAEREADQIGMMIIVVAGFDPRVAPLAFEKLGHSGRLLSTHPKSKKRAQLLYRSKIMEEALKLYREVSPDQETEDSI